MLLRGFARPKALWPFGLFRSPPAHVLHAAPGLRAGVHDHSGQVLPGAGDTTEADAYYCGQFSFAGETVATLPEELFALHRPSFAWREERDGLAWLKHFAARPRRLHVYYVARLIGCWMKLSSPTKSIAVESQRLDHLTEVLPKLASHAGSREQAIFRQALELQCARLLHIKAEAPHEGVVQSLCVLRLVYRVANFSRLAEQALQKLAANLPQLILPDGSDVWGDTDRAMELADSLVSLTENDASGQLSPSVMACCDRLYAYLAMFRFGPQLWSTAIMGSVSARLEQVLQDRHPQGQAPQGGRSQLQQAATKILAHWGTGLRQFLLEVAHKGKPAFCIRHDGSTQHMLPAPPERQTEAGQGELLNMAWVNKELRWNRSVYLAADGKDIRFEDCWQGDIAPAAIEIDVPPQSKILRAREVSEISIILPDGPCWQLKVRGGSITIPVSGDRVRITGLKDAAECIQWALKLQKPAKPRGGKSQKRPEQESELPF